MADLLMEMVEKFDKEDLHRSEGSESLQEPVLDDSEVTTE